MEVLKQETIKIPIDSDPAGRELQEFNLTIQKHLARLAVEPDIEVDVLLREAAENHSGFLIQEDFS